MKIQRKGQKTLEGDVFPDFLITRIPYFLINSLNWWMGLHCSSVLYTQWKTQKKVMGKILVAGKHLNLGVSGPGEVPCLLGGDKIEWYWG